MQYDEAEERDPFTEKKYWLQRIKFSEADACACIGGPKGSTLCYCQLNNKKAYARWIIDQVDNILEYDSND